jgi:hypothetical protein
MATLPHDTYASPGIPLWARATSGSTFVSPSSVVNSDTTQALTETVGGGVASIEFNSVPAGTAFNKITLDGIANGVGITTNNIETFRTTTQTTTIHGTMDVVNRTTGGTIALDGTRILYNDVPQLSMDATFTQVGTHSYDDNSGWTTYNTNSSNHWTTMNDNQFSMFQNQSGSPQTLSYNLNSIFCPNGNYTDLIFRQPQDANVLPMYFLSGGGTLTGTGGSPPYNLTATQSGSIPASLSFRFGIDATTKNYLTSQMPFIWEMTMFDPGANEYAVNDITAPAPINSLVNFIRNDGTLKMDVIGGGTITYTTGQVLRFVYRFTNPAINQARVWVSLDNVVVGGAYYTATLSTDYTPVIQTQYLASVPPGTTISTTMNSYNLSSATGFQGFTWSSLQDGLYPALLSVLAPGGTAPSGWNFANITNNQTLTFPTFSGIQPGTPITLTFYTGAVNYLGSPTYQIIINGVGNTYSLTSAWVHQSIGFVTTGNDLIVLKSLTGAGGVMSVQAIHFGWSIPTAFQIGGIGTDAVNEIVIGTGDIYSTKQIVIDNTPEVTLNAPLFTQGINVQGNDVTAVGTLHADVVITNVLTPKDFSYVSVSGDLTFGGTGNVYNCRAITTSSLDAIAGTTDLYIGATTSNVYLSNIAGLTITTATINSVEGCLNVNNNSGNTTIGGGNFATYLSNVYSIESGTAGAMTINYVNRINGMSATPCATMWYKNASGVYVSVAIQPKQDGTANTIVFPSYVSFVGVGQTMSITLPGNSYFTITDGAVYGRWDNTNTTPVVRDITSGNFNFASSTQYYQLLPYV